MSLTLTAPELERLRSTITTLARPLEDDDVDDWRRQVNRSVRELLQGDQAISMVPGCGASPMFSAQYGEDMIIPYLEHYRFMDEGMRRAMDRGTGVYSLAELFAGELPTLFTSECYNDFHARHGIGDSVGLIIDPGMELSPGLWVHHRRFGHPSSGARGSEILRLLLPAFRAGAAARRLFHRQRDRLAALIDEHEEPTAVMDLRGRVLHWNTALRRVLDGNPDRNIIEARVASTARAAGALVQPDSATEAPALHRSFRAGGHAWVAQGVLVGGPLGMGREGVVVSLRATGGPPTVRHLTARFGLTKREAEVARLLWERKTNAELADALFISQHTARHHTERIFSKLGIRSRREVRGALEGLPEPVGRGGARESGSRS